MAKELSIFNSLLEGFNLKAIVDKRADKFNEPWYKKYFRTGVPSASLNYTTILGKNTVAAAASIIDRDSTTPVHGRQAAEKLAGEVPAIKVARVMDEADYRNLISLQALNSPALASAALTNAFDDVKYVVDSVENKIDLMVLEIVSTGQLTVDMETNPDGSVLSAPVDLGMPAENVKTVAQLWSNPDTDIIGELVEIVNEAGNRDLYFETMLITPKVWGYMVKNKSVQAAVAGVLISQLKNVSSTVTLAKYNDYAAEAELPKIELVKKTIPVLKNGKVVGNIKAFKENNVALIPGGDLGEIHNAIAIEELKKSSTIESTKKGNIHVTKWSSNEPFAETTKAEYNAFPGYEQIANSIIIKTDVLTEAPAQGGE